MSEASNTPQMPDPQKQQLDALEQATKHQLEALAQQRQMAMESAKYWDNMAKQAAAAQPDAKAPLPPTVLTEAHFNYLESVLKAQADFIRTILNAGPR